MNYKFLKDWEDLPAGSVVTADALIARGLTQKDLDGGVEDGTLEAVPVDADQNVQTEEEKAAAEAAAKEAADAEERQKVADAAAAEAETAALAAAAPASTLVYQGKHVVSDGIRTVNDKDYHHIRTEDGAEFDLTDSEYAEVVEASPK